MNKIGIVGQGFVGTALKEGLKQYFQIETYDIDPEKPSTQFTLGELSEQLDVIFICLPTPMNSDGSCYLGIVEETLDYLNNINRYHKTLKTIIVKSTIPPGTTERWNKKYNNIQIVFNPEFLTEANAVKDYENQNRIILGGPRNGTTPLKPIFAKVFPKAKVIKTNSTYAEMVKYLTNSFLATKVSFANEMYQICNEVGADYDKVIEYATYDERLGNSHWSVPGPDGDLGYGGHCFPKDVKALINVAETLKIEPTVLIATDKKNNQVRTNRDWEQMIGRAIL